ncbi:MAG: glycoside hydrolase family 5 protein [Verrucomicrobiales bacterium]|nr:glycoside hydrolase family 5 protein [Verrucomicrobiota bacterium JB025]
MFKLLSIVLAIAATPCAAETLVQATEARLFLTVPDGQPPLTGLTTTTGGIRRANWLKTEAENSRLIDISFPINWRRWQSSTVRFTPAFTGHIRLSLLGPWKPDGSGSLCRQEVLWDELTATGTTIRNGSFESQSADAPDHWQTQSHSYPAPGAWPLDQREPLAGSHVAASWHNRMLHQDLPVTAGTPVTLTIHARAATLPGFTAPKRLGNHTPAHRACVTLKRGVNLGNGWESPPGSQWGILFTPGDIDHIADEGFDHIRVPVAWHHYLQPGKNTIDPELLAGLEPVLRRALDRNLTILLDWHHYDAFTADPASHTGDFIHGWQTIARHFADWPPRLFFELLNEPHDKATTAVMNTVHAQTIAAIRQSNPKRILLISPGHWGSVRELESLRPPDNDDRIIVTIHCYNPFEFTHQGADWTGNRHLTGITYPGPPDSPWQVPAELTKRPGIHEFATNYNTLSGDQNPISPATAQRLLDAARQWSDDFGRPIHLGEFGAFQAADLPSRLRYTRDIRTLAEARRIPWTLWEWKAGFGYWNPQSNTPVLRPAIFD